MSPESPEAPEPSGQYTSDILQAPNEEYVCWCQKVSKGDIVAAIEAGARSFVAVQEKTGACAGGDCINNNPRSRCCSAEIRILLKHCGVLFG